MYPNKSLDMAVFSNPARPQGVEDEGELLS